MSAPLPIGTHRRKRRIILLVHRCAVLIAAPLTSPAASHAEAPLIFTDPTPVTTAADGGLRPAVGVHLQQVFRANRTRSTHADGLGDTYLHAPMLAWWRGKFHLEYLSGPRDEHESPCVTSLTTSADGLTWSAPRVIFPPFKLPDGTRTIAHQRMGFYVAPDGRLLVLSYYGKAPAPNDGTGIGRAVREIHPDDSLGPIYFIKLNSKPPFPGFTPPYPLYTDSPDRSFITACEALLRNQLMTAQWWEEDSLDESGFYRIKGKALSFVHRPDGSVLGIWKNALVATTRDEGLTWSSKVFAPHLANNASKYWLQHTPDDRYALFFNPTGRLRHPLAVATSSDGISFGDLLAVHGELPDQRFGGAFKNMGPQYVRGIVEGNGMPPDHRNAAWITYSVNKEDIWVARVPSPITGRVTGTISDSFDSSPSGSPPPGWNTYSPVWAPVRVVGGAAGPGNVLELRDEDPWDYARAVRVFPETHGVKISFKVLAKQTGGRLEIELLDAKGQRPVRLAWEESGEIRACHEGQWLAAGRYSSGAWQTVELEIPASPGADRCGVMIDGRTLLSRPAIFTDPATSVERLSFRTGEFRYRGFGGRDLPHADIPAALSVFQIDDVKILPISTGP
ncbi:MAG: hypothetical protein KBA71_12385 [Opitutaceae bacterium]|nr:hypothetical protein [Opitutaceae bacterium]